MGNKFGFAAVFAATASAFPFVARQAGVNTALLRRQNTGPGSLSQCNNPNRVPAAPVTAQFPYNNATNGQKGNQAGGYPVPYPDDPDHQFIAPDYSVDIRGPCPGLNTAANYGFIEHGGVTNYNELVDAQQNLYNLDYETSVLLAVLGIVTAGDPFTETLSIGCDYSTTVGGLDSHNKFEADTSLTRNDYFTSGGNNFEMNGTLFQMMTETTGGNYSLDQLALYRAQRYNQSVAENPDFYFGPLSLLLYGAASFLYELMPGEGGSSDVATISSFFGAESDGNGGYTFNGMERIPEGWYARSGSYGSVLNEIEKMYFQYPVLFGGNTAAGSFDALNYGIIQNGQITQDVSATSLTCFIYQLATEGFPTALNSVLSLPVDAVNFAVGKLAPQMQNLGCPVPLLTK